MKFRRAVAAINRSAIPRIVAVAFVVAVVAIVVVVSRLNRTASQQQTYEVRSKLVDLVAGPSKTLALYDTRSTDKLLEYVAGAPQAAQVLGLQLELTDVSDEGMRFVGRLPNLKALVIYGGRPGIGDAGIEVLAGSGVKRLALVNTHISDRGLGDLHSLKKVEVLTVYGDTTRIRGVSDKGVLSIALCRQLKVLQLGGSWMSNNAIEELRARLPGCRISRINDPGIVFDSPSLQ
jgi:hypothetical protein